MADEACQGRFLQIVPSEAKDYNKARCRMDIKTIEYLGLIVGSPVRIKISNRYIYCKVWPRKDVDGFNIIQIDGLITSPVLTRNVEHSCTQYLSIPQDIQKLQPKECDSVSVNVLVRDINNNRNRISKARYKAQLARRLSVLLKELPIEKGCVVKPRQSRNTNTLYCAISSVNINDVQSNTTDCTYYNITDNTRINVESVKIGHSSDDSTQLIMAGLDDAAQMLREMLLYPFEYPESFAHMALECPKGILLHGAPGVGKTLLVKNVTAECNAQLISINGTDIFGPHSGESEENLRKTFEQASFASTSGPCVLFIDELDALCPKRGTSGNEEENRIVAQLLTLMDGIKSRGRLVIIGATNRPNSIDSALRRPGRFDREVVIGVPGPVKRLAILKAHTANLQLAADVHLSHIAEITIGYVGADLASLCREAAFTAMKRSLQDRSVKMCDFQLAMCHITPSTHRGMEGLVHVQPTSWSNIGGLHKVKKALKQAIEWPLKHPEAFSRLGLQRPRAVLLYGPPGCCKTTLVRALASSCNCTFLSLSCAQLYSPYVGDAERMIREVFLKARATAPSILFLDELDSIAGKRSGSIGNDVRSRLLASLLNEVDGVGVSANIYDSTTNSSDRGSTLQLQQQDINGEIHQKLSSEQRLAKLQNVKDLILVAATNRPGAIDEALLRPGRIDRMIYVPPPDRDARLEILKVHASISPVSSDVDLELLADKTDMFSGADLENLCREAALFSLEENLSASKIYNEHFNKALLTVKPSLNQLILSSYKQL